jgi:hypothetical protein
MNYLGQELAAFGVGPGRPCPDCGSYEFDVTFDAERNVVLCDDKECELEYGLSQAIVTRVSCTGCGKVFSHKEEQ